jgi:hypothetical protein
MIVDRIPLAVFARDPRGSLTEVLMSALPWTMLLGMGTILTAVPAQAQTYDPRYPVCMQVYSRDGSFIGCGYTLMAQCAASASGRAAQCFANPYFARTDKKASRRAYRRQTPAERGGSRSS